MAYDVIYVPRVQDEVVVASFETLEEANNHMKLIEKENPRHTSITIFKREKKVGPMRIVE